MPLTAGTPLDVLTERLARGGWGDLGTPTLRGLAKTLDALASVLDPRTGAGKVTAKQLAERTCYTERWVRRCLTLLEELEVIEWARGGIVNGSPTPSWIRVSKAVLVDLVHIARRQQGDRLTEGRRETRRRVAALRTSYTQRRPQDRKRRRGHRGASHAELSTALLSTEEGTTAVPAAVGIENTKNDGAKAPNSYARSAMARIRADLAARRRLEAPETPQRQEGRRVLASAV